jgi:hypothetical protein
MSSSDEAGSNPRRLASACQPIVRGREASLTAESCGKKSTGRPEGKLEFLTAYCLDNIVAVNEFPG